MIREDDFKISRRPYAVLLDSLHAHFHHIERTAPIPNAERGFWDCRIEAVWFRRRRNETVAVSGQLWALQDTEPADGTDFLRKHTDGRYGGSAEARWDGTSFWHNQLTLDSAEYRLDILRPMLANYPAIPPGYDGWWRFETTKEKSR